MTRLNWSQGVSRNSRAYNSLICRAISDKSNQNIVKDICIYWRFTANLPTVQLCYVWKSIRVSSYWQIGKLSGKEMKTRWQNQAEKRGIHEMFLCLGNIAARSFNVWSLSSIQIGFTAVFNQKAERMPKRFSRLYICLNLMVLMTLTQLKHQTQ